MKVLSRLNALLMCAALVIPAGKALAHGELVSSAPGHEAVVTMPEALILNFNDDVRLLRLALVHGASHNIDLGFSPSTEAKSSFTHELPELMIGAHTVDWTIIGPDGHTVSGTFNFVVSEGGEQAEVQDHTNNEHHHH
ncbi:MAG: copper resistance protein CopC [Pseudohongiella sp.]|uniref:copper resistance protein CopC n=1 Tax=Pseudohongiella sp. TaxID=1979412 RepID=UPI0034A0287B